MGIGTCAFILELSCFDRCCSKRCMDKKCFGWIIEKDESWETTTPIIAPPTPVLEFEYLSKRTVHCKFGMCCFSMCLWKCDHDKDTNVNYKNSLMK